MKTALIVAMTNDYVIGKDNDMPWHLPEDLKLFKATTSGHIIAMGRKTYESIGRPLPNRENFVISRAGKPIEGCSVYKSVQECIDAAEDSDKTLFFIGGGQIYAEVVNIVDEMHISYVKESPEGDTYFPEFDKADFEEVESADYEGFIYKKFKRLL